MTDVKWDRHKAVEFSVKIDGWMDRDELEWLYDRASEIPIGGTWVEVGCWKGRSLFSTAMGLPYGARLVAVDTFSGDNLSEHHWDGREVNGWLLDNVRIVVNAVRAIRGKSAPEIEILALESAAAAKVLGTPINAVFIDAQHDYNSIVSDLGAWRPLLAKDGLFSGHDRNYPDVGKALLELVPGVQEGPKTIWYSRV